MDTGDFFLFIYLFLRWLEVKKKSFRKIAEVTFSPCKTGLRAAKKTQAAARCLSFLEIKKISAETRCLQLKYL